MIDEQNAQENLKKQIADFGIQDVLEDLRHIFTEDDEGMDPNEEQNNFTP